MKKTFDENVKSDIEFTQYLLETKKGDMRHLQKVEMLDAARLLRDKGYRLYGTGGTAKFLNENNIPCTHVYWPSDDGQEPQALDLLHHHVVDLVVNIPKNLTEHELTNGYKIRRTAVDLNIPLLTNARLASAFIQAFCSLNEDDLQIKPWNDYQLTPVGH